MTSHLPGLLAIALYLLASGLLAARLARCQSGPGCQRSWIILLAVIAILIHGALLYPAILPAGGLDLGFFNAVCLIGLLTATLLVLATLQAPVESLGIPVFPIAALSLCLMLLYPSDQAAAGVDRSWQLDTHIMMSLLAYSILGLAAVQALLLAIQNHHLHSRQPGGFIRSLPPLQTMESLMFQMIAIGFVLLTLALVTGIMFLEDIFAQHLVHKTVLSIGAWLVFATLLWGRWRFGWRGSVAIRWTIGGYIFLMLAFIGSKLVLEIILNR